MSVGGISAATKVVNISEKNNYGVYHFEGPNFREVTFFFENLPLNFEVGVCHPSSPPPG